MNVAHYGLKTKQFHSKSSKLTLNSIILSYTKISALHLVPEDLNKKQIISKNCVKNHLKIFVLKLCEIPNTCRKIYLYFYKSSTNQTFT